ncbi:hypothetical protein [Macrococcus sp. DPC7161]|uniref:hypothetical protein n=1 Tax=Macrococcus sp. DPC7161 TaxID=2507060 RepID=UPI00100B794A|nr:hypothetical protein [Macrococcus sp. DPC7161]RXK19181.1 hypothetical protein ER639_02370 [Macrococcus sp. DPC7161]
MNKMMKLLIYFIVFYMIACLPSLIVNQHFDFMNLLNVLQTTFIKLLNVSSIVFINQKSGVEYAIFPFIFEPWLNTMSILFGSILIALFFSICFSLFLYRFSKLKIIFAKVFQLLGIIPDIFYIPIMITIVIIIYKETNILLFDVASTSEKSTVLFPMLLLSIIPLLNTINLFEQLTEKESNSTYIDFAFSKGLNHTEVYFQHIFRNIIIGYCINFKQIIWMTLSSTLFLERIMNIFGVSVFIFEYHSPEVLIVSFILLFLPISIVFWLINRFVEQMTGVKI